MHEYEYLWDKPIPLCFTFIFNVYLELSHLSTLVGGITFVRNLTWQDIESYCNVRKLDLKQFEIDYLLKINAWANEEISELEKEEK